MKVGDLKKYKDNLYASLSRDLAEFEKNFLYISVGLLAFSITFITDIVNLDHSFYLIILFLSWGLIIISIGIMMYTFLKSSIASDELWTVVDNFIIANQLFDDDVKIEDYLVDSIKNDVNKVFYQNKKTLKWLRFISVSLFIAGVTCMAIYVSVNMYYYE